MKRSKNIVLALTSVVILSSCKKSPQQDLLGGDEKPSPTATPASGAHAGSIGFFGRPFVPPISSGGSGGSRGFSSFGESVARGGFGSIGASSSHGSSS